MEEADKYQRRLEAIAEKRRLQEEQDRAKREMEDEKLRLQQLKRKSLRDQWLMEGAPLSPTSPDTQSLHSPLWGGQAQEIEKRIDKFQSESQRLAEEEEKLKEQMEDSQMETANEAEAAAEIICDAVVQNGQNGATGLDTTEDEVMTNQSRLLDEPAAVLTNGRVDLDADTSNQSSTNGPVVASDSVASVKLESGLTLGVFETQPGQDLNVSSHEDDEEGTLVMRAERVIITDEGDDVPDDQEDQQETMSKELALQNEETGRAEGEESVEEVVKTESAPEMFTQPEKSEATKAAAEARPANEATAEAQPATEAAAEARPANEATAEAQPATEAAAEAQPATEAAAEAQPATEAAAEAQPATEAAAEVQPATEAAAEAQPATEAAAEAQPATEAAAEVQPATEAAAEVQPATEAAAEAQTATATANGNIHGDMKTNENGDRETKAEGQDNQSEDPSSVQSPSDALEGITVASVPVYSESALTPDLEAEVTTAVSPKEAEAAPKAQDPVALPSHFQEVPLADPQEKQRTEAGPSEQEPLLLQAKTPDISVEPTAANSPASAETHSPTRSSPDEAATAPKSKTCQCCSVM